LTARESVLVGRLREIAATEYGALAIVDHLGEWFELFLEGWDRAPTARE
jgi:hypothetical protein